MKEMVILLVRKRLRLKKYEMFQFEGQKTDAKYYFTDTEVVKLYNGSCKPSSVSLNWLLDDNCKISKVN